jgi:nitroreductase
MQINTIKVKKFIVQAYNNSALQKLAWSLRHYREIRQSGAHQIKHYAKLDLIHLPDNELLAIAKHEAHRIEKAHYVNMLHKRIAYYESSHKVLQRCLALLESRMGNDISRPDLTWLNRICNDYPDLSTFVEESNTNPPEPDFKHIEKELEILKSRRSSRVWAANQPPPQTLAAWVKKLVEAATWAPCSGNRQPWYFHFLVEEQDKRLLKGIKEEHCYTAPCVVFVGMDRRAYGALGVSEQGLYVDAGAAAMQMVALATRLGLGSCWNHFCRDLIYSRPKNIKVYKNFTKTLGIPSDIEPVCLLAFGVPAFISPRPERPPVESLLHTGTSQRS